VASCEKWREVKSAQNFEGKFITIDLLVVKHHKSISPTTNFVGRNLGMKVIAH
jgi:hypothetical protein